jgi:hypothetical protein
MLKHSIFYSSFSIAIAFSLIVSVSWPLVDLLIVVELLNNPRNAPYTHKHLNHTNLTHNLSL